MLKLIEKMKKATNKRWMIPAVFETLKLGLAEIDDQTEITTMRQDLERLSQEHLEMARLVHEYETKLVNLERRAFEAEEAKKKLEWGYRALLKENKWMKEELIEMKREP